MTAKDNEHTIISILVDEFPRLSLEELCSVCHTTPEFIKELVDHGLLEPEGYSPANWRFHATHVRIIRTALHLHHDLEINSAGVALAIDLINELETMRERLAVLEKHFLIRR